MERRCVLVAVAVGHGRMAHQLGLTVIEHQVVRAQGRRVDASHLRRVCQSRLVVCHHASGATFLLDFGARLRHQANYRSIRVHGRFGFDGIWKLKALRHEKPPLNVVCRTEAVQVGSHEFSHEAGRRIRRWAVLGAVAPRRRGCLVISAGFSRRHGIFSTGRAVLVCAHRQHKL